MNRCHPISKQAEDTIGTTPRLSLRTAKQARPALPGIRISASIPLPKDCNAATVRERFLAPRSHWPRKDWGAWAALLPALTFHLVGPIHAALALAEQPAAVLPGPPVEPVPDAGLWPTEKLMQSMVMRWADDVIDEWELDEDQRRAVRDRVARRWIEYLRENRAELQPLLNDFLEMRLALEPPAPYLVAEWARRAETAFDKVRVHFEGAQQDFREDLTPAQRLHFEARWLMFSAAMSHMHARLKSWQEGEFRQEEIWEETGRARRERRAREKAEKSANAEAKKPPASSEPSDEAGSPPPPDQIAAELDRWDEYVAGFVRDYQLDEGQRTAALSCLAELRERAIAHRDRRRDEINDLERQIQRGTRSDAELEEIQKRLVDLYGPIDALFEELRRRLDAIPSRAQRERRDLGDSSVKKSAALEEKPVPAGENSGSPR